MWQGHPSPAAHPEEDACSRAAHVRFMFHAQVRTAGPCASPPLGLSLIEPLATYLLPSWRTKAATADGPDQQVDRAEAWQLPQQGWKQLLGMRGGPPA